MFRRLLITTFVFSVVGMGYGSLVYAQIPLETKSLMGQVDSTATVEVLQKQIQQLLAQLQTLQQQVTTLQTELGVRFVATTTSAITTQATAEEATSATMAPPELTRPLLRGSRGDDVRSLQEFLARDPEIYPEGLATGFFGPATEAAVKRWQKKQGVESIGIVGPKTIAKFKELGQGVVQGLIREGTPSGTILPGLLAAPGIQKQPQYATSTPPTLISTSTPPLYSTTTPAIPATPVVPATSTPSTVSNIATNTLPVTITAPPPVTPSGTVPVAPATPVIPITSTIDTQPPAMPTGLTAAALTPTQINLSWATSTDNIGVMGYKIYRNNNYLISTAFTTYVDQTVSSATTYAYTVSAYDAAGNVSAQSNSASATTPASSSTNSSPSPSGTDATAPIISTSAGTYSYSANVTANSATINWTTNEPADSQVDWGPWGGVLYNHTPLDTALVTNHSVTLGLYRSSYYQYQIKSRDAAGNLATRYDSVTTMPEISNIQVTNITANSATITWVTSELNDSGVFYSMDTNYGLSVYNATMALSRSMVLSGLTAGTTYHFYVKSKNVNVPQYVATSGDQTFTTLAVAVAPVITSGPTVTRVDTTPYADVAVSWTTDAACSSIVYWGQTSAMGYGNVGNSATTHRVIIDGQPFNTNYYYKVTCTSSNNKTVESAIGTFTTEPASATITATTTATVSISNMVSILDSLTSLLQKLQQLLR